VRLQYRRVNHAERWQAMSMTPAGRVWSATIPREYTMTPYPLQYYFEVTDTPTSVGLYPGLGEMRTRQPYFVVRGK
jgi:hypothetical protein